MPFADASTAGSDGTAEIAPGLLITQRSRVQIPPPLPGKTAPGHRIPEPFSATCDQILVTSTGSISGCFRPELAQASAGLAVGATCRNRHFRKMPRFGDGTFRRGVTSPRRRRSTGRALAVAWHGSRGSPDPLRARSFRQARSGPTAGRASAPGGRRLMLVECVHEVCGRLLIQPTGPGGARQRSWPSWRRSPVSGWTSPVVAVPIWSGWPERRPVGDRLVQVPRASLKPPRTA